MHQRQLVLRMLNGGQLALLRRLPSCIPSGLSGPRVGPRGSFLVQRLRPFQAPQVRRHCLGEAWHLPLVAC